jgi:hypothetical protein
LQSQVLVGASLVLIENERIRADGQSDCELAQHVEGGRGVAGLIAADLRDVDADVLGERALGHFALVAQGG